ncbi:MAG: hypothetical protein ACRC8P_02375 [Spiroplasma sp.]
MKKALVSLSSITFLTTNTLAVTACNKNEYLKLTNDEIFSSPSYPGKSGYPGKLIDLSKTFMLELWEKEKSWWALDSFKSWKWDLENRKEIILNTRAGPIDIPKDKWKWWRLIIRKTKDKGIYVSDYIKINNPIKGANNDWFC